MTDGRKIEGAFQSATDEDLLVQTHKSPQALTRMMIAKVSAKGRSHRFRNALIGFGGGAGVGLIVGAVADNGCPKGGCFPVGKELREASVYAVGSPHRGHRGPRCCRRAGGTSCIAQNKFARVASRGPAGLASTRACLSQAVGRGRRPRNFPASHDPQIRRYGKLTHTKSRRGPFGVAAGSIVRSHPQFVGR